MKIKIFFFSILLFNFITITAQTKFSCKIDGDEFKGKVTEASLVKLYDKNYIQIKVEEDGKILFLHLNTEKIKGELPVKLKFFMDEKNPSPDSELIWAPNQEEPQWNSIEGFAEVISYDETAKLISGKFEFVVEKMEYGSKKKKQTLDIEDGVFNIQFTTN